MLQRLSNTKTLWHQGLCCNLFWRVLRYSTRYKLTKGCPGLLEPWKRNRQLSRKANIPKIVKKLLCKKGTRLIEWQKLMCSKWTFLLINRRQIGTFWFLERRERIQKFALFLKGWRSVKIHHRWKRSTEWEWFLREQPNMLRLISWRFPLWKLLLFNVFYKLKWSTYRLNILIYLCLECKKSFFYFLCRWSFQTTHHYPGILFPSMAMQASDITTSQYSLGILLRNNRSSSIQEAVNLPFHVINARVVTRNILTLPSIWRKAKQPNTWHAYFEIKL